MMKNKKINKYRIFLKYNFLSFFFPPKTFQYRESNRIRTWEYRYMPSAFVEHYFVRSPMEHAKVCFPPLRAEA